MESNTDTLQTYQRVRAILIQYGNITKTIEDSDCIEIWWVDRGYPYSSGVYYRLDPVKAVVPIEDTLIFVPIYSIISISYKK